jgi:hypothetical protein
MYILVEKKTYGTMQYNRTFLLPLYMEVGCLSILYYVVLVGELGNVVSLDSTLNLWYMKTCGGRGACPQAVFSNSFMS